MADLLLELFSEEIPARMQAQAAKDLERLVVGALSDRGLLFEGVKTFWGPRRLTLAMSGLPAKQPDVKEELKGPKVDAPAAALDGFLRKTGLTKEQLKIEKTPKGDVYLAVIDRKGRDTIEVLAEILPNCFAKLPWPKSMRWPQDDGGWGEGGWSEGPFGGSQRWVRPLHGIVCMFDAEVVPFEFAGVKSGNTTMGHRFLSDGAPIKVRHFEDYEKALHDAHVILDAEQRKAIIFEELKAAAFVRGLELIPDEGLLDEVSGLAEWPVVLVGAIQDEFMDVPPEILQTSMRTHQKYFSLRDPKTGTMANRFALVSNMIAEDGGKEIIAGNERVLRARLSDAKFFWDQDRKIPLADRVDALKNIVFHAKLGTQYERVERIEALAGEIAEKTGADVAKAKRAARLAKADLTTGVVGEFPELQGVMGRYYALHDKEDADVADAVRDHYKPVGPSDAVPTNKVSIAVALSDKLDQLIGFFIIGEEPTGSGDPFALRRAALGIIRILITNSVRLRLGHLITEYVHNTVARSPLGRTKFGDFAARYPRVLSFLTTRVSVVMSSEGLRIDCVRAILDNYRDFEDDEAFHRLYQKDDLVWVVRITRELQEFLKTDEGANLLAGYKRAANILKAEQKKDQVSTFEDDPDPEALTLPEEKALYVELATASDLIAAEVQRERFVEAMGVMAKLRGPVDAFFDKVKVNDDDPKLRENRLKLLSRLRATLHLVADFSKIEG
ncbi:MAG TPA: glycine--tRNA ligase subunit beta [Rhizomicrobium sp.]|jgi:glycyl-tRNA synthetase beta chain